MLSRAQPPRVTGWPIYDSFLMTGKLTASGDLRARILVAGDLASVLGEASSRASGRDERPRGGRRADLWRQGVARTCSCGGSSNGRQSRTAWKLTCQRTPRAGRTAISLEAPWGILVRGPKTPPWDYYEPPVRTFVHGRAWRGTWTIAFASQPQPRGRSEWRHSARPVLAASAPEVDLRIRPRACAGGHRRWSLRCDVGGRPPSLNAERGVDRRLIDPDHSNELVAGAVATKNGHARGADAEPAGQ
jgi:hypothetical protein